MSLNLGSPNAEDGDEPALEPINGQVFPPFMPRADKPGRVTNQLKYLRDVVIKVRIPKKNDIFRYFQWKIGLKFVKTP